MAHRMLLFGLHLHVTSHPGIHLLTSGANEPFCITFYTVVDFYLPLRRRLLRPHKQHRHPGTGDIQPVFLKERFFYHGACGCGTGAGDGDWSGGRDVWASR